MFAFTKRGRIPFKNTAHPPFYFIVHFLVVAIAISSDVNNAFVAELNVRVLDDVRVGRALIRAKAESWESLEQDERSVLNLCHTFGGFRSTNAVQPSKI